MEKQSKKQKMKKIKERDKHIKKKNAALLLKELPIDEVGKNPGFFPKKKNRRNVMKIISQSRNARNDSKKFLQVKHSSMPWKYVF